MGIVYRYEAGVSRERAEANRALGDANAEGNRRLDETMQAIEDYYTGVSEEAIRGGGISPELRNRLLERPRQFYARLASELAARPAPTERELELLARGRLALCEVLGTLGRFHELIEEMRAGAEAFTKLAAVHPARPDYRRGLARCYDLLGGAFYSTSRMDESVAAHREAIRIYTNLVRENPDVLSYRYELARNYRFAGNGLKASGRMTEAAQATGDAREQFAALVHARPDDRSYRHGLAWCHSNLGLTSLDLGDPRGGAESLRQAAALHAGLVAAEPKNYTYRDGLAADHINLGRALLEAHRPDEAIGAYRIALEIYAGIARDEPGIPTPNLGRMMGENGVGRALLEMGRTAGAVEAFRRAIEIGRRLSAIRPDISHYQEWLAVGHDNLGDSLLRTGPGRLAEAIEEHRQAIAVLDRLVAARPDYWEPQDRLGVAWGHLGAALAAQGRYEEAAPAYRQAIRHHLSLRDRLPEVVRHRSLLSRHLEGLAQSLLAAGRCNEATDAVRECAGLWPSNPAHLYDCSRLLASGIRQIADRTRRRALEDEAMAILSRAVATGWKDAARIAADPGLAPLRERAEFRDLLAGLFDRGFPADPFAR
jgi:tetratricopeptide (TPR) repeat protein